MRMSCQVGFYLLLLSVMAPKIVCAGDLLPRPVHSITLSDPNPEPEPELDTEPAPAMPSHLKLPLMPTSPPPQYLKPQEIEQLAKSLTPPPTPGSDADKADLDEVIKGQRFRSKRKCQNFLPEDSVNYAGFVKATPDIFAQEKLRSDILILIRDTLAEMDRALGKSHQIWNRPHPSQRDGRVHPCPNEIISSDSSFPSATAARYQLVGLILKELTMNTGDLPLIKKYAEEGGNDRVLSGTHHPSDVAAGRELATKLLASLMKNNTFRQRFKDLIDQAHFWQFRVDPDEWLGPGPVPALTPVPTEAPPSAPVPPPHGRRH